MTYLRRQGFWFTYKRSRDVNKFAPRTEGVTQHNFASLSPATWDDKHAYLSSLGMFGTTHLNSILFADHTTFNNGYMKRAHIRQGMTNDNNFNTSDNPGLLSHATTVTLNFKLKINVNSIKCYLVRSVQFSPASLYPIHRPFIKTGPNVNDSSHFLP